VFVSSVLALSCAQTLRSKIFGHCVLTESRGGLIFLLTL
jgi:hypothetical protein